MLVFAAIVSSLIALVVGKCDNFDLKLHSVAHCDPRAKNVITIDPDSYVTYEGCDAIPHTCVKWDDISEGLVHYQIQKDGGTARIKGTFDLCGEGHHHSNVRFIFRSIGLPTTCPAKKGERCLNGEKRIDMSKHKMALAMLRGRSKITLQVDHGKAGTTCVIIDLEVTG